MTESQRRSNRLEVSIVPERAALVSKSGVQLRTIETHIVDLSSPGVRLRCDGAQLNSDDLLALTFSFRDAELSVLGRVVWGSEDEGTPDWQFGLRFEPLDRPVREHLVRLIYEEQAFRRDREGRT